MIKKFSYKIKNTKRVNFIWTLISPAIFLTLYKNNYINLSLLYLNLTILLLSFRQGVKFIKTIGLVYSVIYSYLASKLIKFKFFEDEDGFESVELKQLIYSILLTYSIGLSSFICALGINYLMYTYREYNLGNVMPTYILTLILLLLLARHSDKRYIKLYNLRIKAKKVIAEYE